MSFFSRVFRMYRPPDASEPDPGEVVWVATVDEPVKLTGIRIVAVARRPLYAEFGPSMSGVPSGS